VTRRALLLPLLFACTPPAAVVDDAGSDVDLSAEFPTDLPTRAELALTPRADVVAEDVALRSTPERWTADDDRYDRVAADLDAIAVALPQTTLVTREPERDQNVFVEFKHDDANDEHDADVVAALVEFFGGAAHVDVSESFVVIEASWPGLLQPQKVDAAIAAIVDDEALGVGADIPEGPFIDVEVDGDVFRYRFMNKGGDCPAGCTTLQAFYVETAPGAAPLLLDSFDSVTATACPPWTGPGCQLGD
jgi:hypothetical protein